jgi:hypothetical protein
MSTSPHDLRWTKIKKVISRHLLSATEDTHRIGLQGTELGIGWFMAREKGLVTSVLFRMSVLGQHSKYIPVINMHDKSLRSLVGIL